MSGKRIAVLCVSTADC